ncbi:hypothetical protein LWI28_010389 [Acer negundo]|uniref:Uncharacterized protein n=1 Tax=Acer negundo TaxID=4023 RepID=A0AAD5IA91_ACENE|nr:hypothetical protein LWI28_010389 [Acer negundo]
MAGVDSIKIRVKLHQTPSEMEIGDPQSPLMWQTQIHTISKPKSNFFLFTASTKSKLALLNKSASWSGRPPGVFMCTSLNNVGKAELARAIAGDLYDNEDHLVRFDMSKYDSV